MFRLLGILILLSLFFDVFGAESDNVLFKLNCDDVYKKLLLYSNESFLRKDISELTYENNKLDPVLLAHNKLGVFVAPNYSGINYKFEQKTVGNHIFNTYSTTIKYTSITHGFYEVNYTDREYYKEVVKGKYHSHLDSKSLFELLMNALGKNVWDNSCQGESYENNISMLTTPLIIPGTPGIVDVFYLRNINALLLVKQKHKESIKVIYPALLSQDSLVIHTYYGDERDIKSVIMMLANIRSVNEIRNSIHLN